MRTFGKKNVAGILIIAIILAVLALFNSWMGRKNEGFGDPGAWVYSYGDWYFEQDGERLKNQWVDDHVYFVDEGGRMVKNEWIYEPNTEPGRYVHSDLIPAAEFAQIDMEHLSYVGHDGKIIRNKTIYFTPFQFDNRGYCSLSEDEIFKFENAEYGIEGLRRYVVFHEGYKEYY